MSNKEVVTGLVAGAAIILLIVSSLAVVAAVFIAY